MAVATAGEVVKGLSGMEVRRRLSAEKSSGAGIDE
jgi:hypothetical protein